MSSVIQDIESSQLRGDIPDFAPGDRVKVHFLVIEGNRKRPQVFEGVVIRRQGSGARETFTVRKQSFGVGVERTFPVHSPKIEKLEVASRGAVRRAKLYYLRGRTGKAARVAERRWGIDEEVIAPGGSGAIDASGEGLAPEEPPAEIPAEQEGGEAGEPREQADGEGSEADAEVPPDQQDASSGQQAKQTDDSTAAGEPEAGDGGESSEAHSDATPEAEAEADSGEEAGEGSDETDGEESTDGDAEPGGDRDEA